MVKKTYSVIGMHCAACKSLLEQTVAALPGIKQAGVNFATEKLTVEFDPQQSNFAKIQKAVRSVGRYDLLETMSHVHTADKEQLGVKVLVSGLATLPFLLMMLGLLPAWLMNHSLWQFWLATPVLFWAGFPIFQSAFSAFKAKTSNMDTLITVGTLSAWGYSALVTFRPHLFLEVTDKHAVYFEASVFILFFILLGRWLEQRAKKQAGQTIAALFKLQAKDARVLRSGKELMIPIAQVMVGDVIKVKPGEKIPVDGIILKGATAVNEAALTGESLPVEKQAHDLVIGATLNTYGTFTYRVQKVGADTLFAQIIKLVEEAQATQAPVQKLADRVAAVFVPTVIGIAVVTFVVWLLFTSFSQALYASITVLIIACPCALGLATPLAVMVGSGQAAKGGILIKDAKALELSHRLNTIVFDKTGTLTLAKPQVKTYTITHPRFNALVLAAQSQSHHPLAQATVTYLQSRVNSILPEVSHFQDFPGLGIRAKITQTVVLIGTEKLLLTNKIKLTPAWQTQAKALQQQGQTVSYIVINNRVQGLMGITDTVKPEAVSVIKKLRRLHLHTVLLTGDNYVVAQNLAKALGVDEFQAEVLPQEKAQVIVKLQNLPQGRQIVAMVGDGINDAPALASADVGIAMGTGTEVAVNTGDVVLVKGTLDKVLEALALSRRTYRVIKQNLFWAFGYNIVGIPVAAGVLYPLTGLLLSPVIASMAMAFSSVSVVLNSLRLSR